MTRPTRPPVFDFSPEMRNYYRELGAAADVIEARYSLDDMGQATPAMLAELAALNEAIDRRYGAPTT